MSPGDRDTRYDERWPSTTSEREPGQERISARRHVALWVFTGLPWVLYFGLIVSAGWLVMFDGDPSTDTLGWTLLALALPCLFVAARVSSWQRRWIHARFDLEMWARGPSGGGGFLDWLLGP